MKIKLTVLMILIIFLISSCASFTYPVDHDKSFPPDGRYEILGPVTSISMYFVILGIVCFEQWEGAGYKGLLDAATEKFNKVDDVVNVSVDQEFNTVLGVVIWVKTTIRGTAIRYVKGQADPTAVSSEE